MTTLVPQQMIAGGPAFSAYQSSAQTPSAGTWTKIQFQTKEFDTNSNFDSVTNYRFTPTVAGYYQVNSACGQNGAAIGSYISLYKNGSQFKTGASSNASFLNMVSALIYFNGTTDYVESYVYQGTSTTLTTGVSACYFQAFLARTA